MFVILPPFFTPLDYCYSNAMLVDFFFNQGGMVYVCATMCDHGVCHAVYESVIVYAVCVWGVCKKIPQ